MGGRRRTRIVSRGEVEKLSTPRLQAYRKRLYSICEQKDWENLAENMGPGLVTPDTPSMVKAIEDVKAVMASREHLNR